MTAPRKGRYLLTLNCRCFGWVGIALESDSRDVRCEVCKQPLKEVA